jgi:hypothetical protein
MPEIIDLDYFLPLNEINDQIAEWILAMTPPTPGFLKTDRLLGSI